MAAGSVSDGEAISTCENKAFESPLHRLRQAVIAFHSPHFELTIVQQRLLVHAAPPKSHFSFLKWFSFILVICDHEPPQKAAFGELLYLHA